MNLADIANRLARVEKQTEANSKILGELAQKFGWYWRDEKRKSFAIVGRIFKDKADLIVFDTGWSGGFMLIDESPLFIEDPTIPLDEQPREGCWEPMVDLEDILDSAIKLTAKAEAISGQASATAPDTTAA